LDLISELVVLEFEVTGLCTKRNYPLYSSSPSFLYWLRTAAIGTIFKLSYLYSTCIDSTWIITNEHGSGHRRGGVDWPVGCTWPEKGMQVEDVSQN
jgi:hypothetical protein